MHKDDVRLSENLAEIVVLVRTPEIAFHAEISKRLGWHKPGSP